MRSCGSCSDYGTCPSSRRPTHPHACRHDCCAWCAAIWSPVLRSVAELQRRFACWRRRPRPNTRNRWRANWAFAMCWRRRARATRRSPAIAATHKCRPRPGVPGQRRGWAQRPRIFFNDHLDDLPLMQVSQAVCWFGGRRTLADARGQPHRTCASCHARGLTADGDAADAGASPAEPGSGSARRQGDLGQGRAPALSRRSPAGRARAARGRADRPRTAS